MEMIQHYRKSVAGSLEHPMALRRAACSVVTTEAKYASYAKVHSSSPPFLIAVQVMLFFLFGDNLKDMRTCIDGIQIA